MRLLFSLLVLAACGAEHPAAAPASAPAPAADPSEAAKKERLAQREHCEVHDNDRGRCSRDPQCLPILVPACDRCDGGKYACTACLEVVELRGIPRDFCRLRAEGRTEEACRLLHPHDPERCAPKVADAGVTPAM